MKILKWVKRILLGLILLIVLAFLLGFVYEQIQRSSAEKEFQPTGKLVDVGGYDLHYLEKGMGGPTVVFESGLDASGHLPWFKVQDEIAKNTTTISYDRAGIMWSERGTNPKTIKAMGEDLRTLLEKSGAPKPFILVGHSLAGLTLKQYIVDNRADISGIVFVDASSPFLFDKASEELKAAMPKPPPNWVLKIIASTGIYRHMFAGQYTNDETDMINILSNKFKYKSLDAFFEETNSIEELAADARTITSFGAIPLKVISAAHENRLNYIPDVKMRQEMLSIGGELQRELLDLSSNSEQILAKNSGHYVQLDEPELIIDTILYLISESKASIEE